MRRRLPWLARTIPAMRQPSFGRWAAPATCARSMPARRACAWWSQASPPWTTAALKALGARGLIRPTADTLQVVVGPVADQLAGDIRRGLRGGPPGAGPSLDCAALLAALGGATNVRAVEANSTRLLVGVADDARVDEAALAAASPRGFARPASGSVHVIVGPGAAAGREALARLAAAVSRRPGRRTAQPSRKPATSSR